MDLEAVATSAANALSAHLALPEVEATLLATGDAQVTQLNADHRDKAKATNVLSWPSADRIPGAPLVPDAWGELHLGDVALAFQTCSREAADQDKPVADHVCHLIVHGLLHLLGYDHETDSDAAMMEGLEREILGKLGLPDPY
ncbi:MAG: rRNA maturation RNase YbeY [Pseudomonadota bacterium]